MIMRTLAGKKRPVLPALSLYLAIAPLNTPLQTAPLDSRKPTLPHPSPNVRAQAAPVASRTGRPKSRPILISSNPDEAKGRLPVRPPLLPQAAQLPTLETGLSSSQGPRTRENASSDHVEPPAAKKRRVIAPSATQPRFHQGGAFKKCVAAAEEVDSDEDNLSADDDDASSGGVGSEGNLADVAIVGAEELRKGRAGTQSASRQGQANRTRSAAPRTGSGGTCPSAAAASGFPTRQQLSTCLDAACADDYNNLKIDFKMMEADRDRMCDGYDTYLAEKKEALATVAEKDSQIESLRRDLSVAEGKASKATKKLAQGGGKGDRCGTEAEVKKYRKRTRAPAPTDDAKQNNAITEAEKYETSNKDGVDACHGKLVKVSDSELSALPADPRMRLT